MFCPNCGTSNDDLNKFCQNCGTSLDLAVTSAEHVVEENNYNNENNYNQNSNTTAYNNYAPQMPSFSSGHSIFLIIFSLLCCGGIIGVIFAVLSLVEGNKVNEYAANGDYENAVRCKNAANKWIKATYITWAVVAAIMIIYFAFVFFASILATL